MNTLELGIFPQEINDLIEAIERSNIPFIDCAKIFRENVEVEILPEEKFEQKMGEINEEYLQENGNVVAVKKYYSIKCGNIATIQRKKGKKGKIFIFFIEDKKKENNKRFVFFPLFSSHQIKPVIPAKAGIYDNSNTCFNSGFPPARE